MLWAVSGNNFKYSVFFEGTTITGSGGSLLQDTKNNIKKQSIASFVLKGIIFFNVNSFQIPCSYALFKFEDTKVMVFAIQIKKVCSNEKCSIFVATVVVAIP
jgi:hypothetical protein